jgi:hypothetical protein
MEKRIIFPNFYLKKKKKIEIKLIKEKKNNIIPKTTFLSLNIDLLVSTNF